MLQLALLVGTAAMCPEGFIERKPPSASESAPSSCYKRIVAEGGVGVGYTHAECSKECARHNSALACIGSQEESEWIRANFPVNSECCFRDIGRSMGPFDTSCCTYIGLYQGDSETSTVQIDSDEGWKHWSSGCDSKFTHWFPGEPNDFGGHDENCAFYGMPFEKAGAWFDVGCQSRMGCLCQGSHESPAARLHAPHRDRLQRCLSSPCHCLLPPVAVCRSRRLVASAAPLPFRLPLPLPFRREAAACFGGLASLNRGGRPRREHRGIPPLRAERAVQGLQQRRRARNLCKARREPRR